MTRCVTLLVCHQLAAVFAVSSGGICLTSLLGKDIYLRLNVIHSTHCSKTMQYFTRESAWSVMYMLCIDHLCIRCYPQFLSRREHPVSVIYTADKLHRIAWNVLWDGRISVEVGW